MNNQGKSQLDEVVLVSLACGATIDAAASKSGVSKRTIYRRLQDPKFQKRLREIRSEMVERASAMLTASAIEAVKTLLDLQKSNVPHATRLGAARAILELGVRLRESVELMDRIAKLENRLQMA